MNPFKIFKNKNELSLTKRQKDDVQERTIEKASKKVEDLKTKEEKARKKVMDNLRDVFDELPFLL